MTLAEWKNAYKPRPATLKHSFWRNSIPDSALWDLYHLEDYAVSTSTANEVILVPKTGHTPPAKYIYYPEDWGS